MIRIITLAAVLTLVLSAISVAGVNENARVTIHVVPHASWSCTKNYPSIDACGDISTTEASADVDAFPVFYDLVEWQGFDYGMTWPGMYSAVFTSCSDFTIGDIVNPGDGISHAWSTCQYDAIKLPGWAWIYDVGLICITVNPTFDFINVGLCEGTTADTIPGYNSCCAGIGGTTGEDACGCDTEPCSWSGIKKMFR